MDIIFHTMNSYNLSRRLWDFAFENPEKIKPTHISLYFFAVEHCNRLGWKKKFGLPAAMCLEAIGIKSYSVYKKTFDDLVNWGFIEVIQYSKNQYSSNIIALKENDKALDKAFDKALIKHGTKQVQSTEQSTEQSIDSIDKQIYNITNIQINKLTNKDFLDLINLKEFKKRLKENNFEISETTKQELNYSNIKPELWIEWIEFKKSQFKESYKNIKTEQTALNQLIKISNNDNKTATEIINKSITGLYKGLFPLQLNNNQKKDHSPTKWEDIKDNPDRMSFK
jgi:hypothetical protein